MNTRPRFSRSASILVLLALAVTGLPLIVAAESAPAFAKFDYSMPDRYVDADDDGLYPDPVSHVECSDPTDASSCRTIAPTLDVEPDEGWRIDLDACESTPGPDEAEYRWSLASTGEPLEVFPGDEPCKFVTYFANEGSYDVQLLVVKPGESSSRRETVRVQDWLIVSMGDSLGAGEGSPNAAATEDGEPLWQDRRCHRSSRAGSAKAAQLLEELDPRTSVTFVHTSCSGARTMEGLLEPYAGVDRLLGEKYPEVTLAAAGEIPMIPPQVHTVSRVVGTREIDAVYLSIGANDIHFADIVQVCAVAEPCDALDFAASGFVLETLACLLLSASPVAGLACAGFALAINASLDAALGDNWVFDTAAEIFERGFEGDGSSGSVCEDCGLEGLYDFIAESLTRSPSTSNSPSRSQVGLGLPAADAARVSIAPYPDPITKPQFDVNDADSFLCGGIEDTLTMFPGISRNETRYMFNTVVPQFEGKIASEAVEHDWHFLEGVSATNRYHGYCADDHYVRRLDESLSRQKDIQGVLHPNGTGYNVYRNVILEQWLTQMYGGTGAGIAASHSTDAARLLAQSFLETTFPRDPVVPTADAGGPYAVAEGDSVQLDGTGTDPDGGELSFAWDLSGTAGAASLADANSEDATLLGIDDGGGRALLTVTNELGRVATDGANYIVSNVAPGVDAGGTATIAEGTALGRTVLVSDPGASDTHSASVTWGDGTSDVIGSAGPPSLKVSHVYADDGIYDVEVCVTDDDGGSDCDSFAVTVTNAPPAVSVGSATADEGSLVALPVTTFGDPGTLDVHRARVSWGDGTPVEPATIAETPFGPPGSTTGLPGTVRSDGGHVYADNGMYTIEVCVTDDDDGLTCSTGSLSIGNVAPVPSITTVGEGPDFFLPGVSVPLAATFTDAGTADTHDAQVAWGDGTSSGSATGGVELDESPFGPPGSTDGLTGTYRSPHTYSTTGLFELATIVSDDDDGSGTVSRQVEVLSAADAAGRAGDLLTDLAGDPTLSAAVRERLAEALRKLTGNPGSNDGADDKFRDGDLGGGMQKLSLAIGDLEAAVASDPSILDDVRLIELVIAQIAESVAIDVLARARAANPNPTRKEADDLAQAQRSLDEGRALKGSSLPGAVAKFHDSVAKSLSVR